MNTKSLSTLLSTLWVMIRYLPAALAFIARVKDAFGSEKVQEAFKAFHDLITQIAPPDPAADGTGAKPPISTGEIKRRWKRFGHRIKAASEMTDHEATFICETHHIPMETPSWT